MYSVFGKAISPLITKIRFINTAYLDYALDHDCVFYNK